MKLIRSCKTNLLTQKFGVSKVCAKLDSNGKAIAPNYILTHKYKGSCPAGYTDLYKIFGLDGHNGWDWGAEHGEEIRWDCLDCDGMVDNLHTDSSGGLGVSIHTEDADGIIRHLFWHLKGFACKPGQVLSTGDLIGYADNTGKSTGTHLHRGIKKGIKSKYGNVITDPAYYNNGFKGAVDIGPYFSENIYVMDYLMRMKGRLDFIQRIIYSLNKILKAFKGR